MLGQEYIRNALLAGSFVALACGLCGWFVVLRGQVFAGDALGHVAFPGALAAATAGVDQRIGLFAATIAAGGAIALLGGGVLAGRGTRGAAGAAVAGEPADDTTIGVAFTAILALGVFFLTRYSLGSGDNGGVAAARTLFGSIFGLSAGEAWLAAGIGAAVVAALALLGRPLLFASATPAVAAARGLSTRLLGFAFLALLGVVAAEASQAVGALLLLGLLAGPAAAAHWLSSSARTSVALAAGLAVGSLWAGVALAWAVPSLPPSTAVVAVSTAVYALARMAR